METSLATNQPRKPSLPKDYFYRIDAPATMASILKNGFIAGTSTRLWREEGLPKESFEAKKDGWEIPTSALMEKPRGYFFTSEEAAFNGMGSKDRILCRYNRNHPDLSEDSLIFVDGAMQYGTVIYVVFPEVSVDDVVIAQGFIEFFDKTRGLWLPLWDWKETPGFALS